MFSLTKMSKRRCICPMSLPHAGYSAVAEWGCLRATVPCCYKEAPSHCDLWDHIPQGDIPRESLRVQICRRLDCVWNVFVCTSWRPLVPFSIQKCLQRRKSLLPFSLRSTGDDPQRGAQLSWCFTDTSVVNFTNLSIASLSWRPFWKYVLKHTNDPLWHVKGQT